MISFLLVIIILSLGIFSSVFIYLLIHSRLHVKSNEKQRIKYTIQPSFSLITKKLPYRLSIHRSSDEIILHTTRSSSLASNLFIKNCTNRRQSSIIDSKQISQIEFALPPSAEKYRRRSVAICNNIIDSPQSTIDSLIKTIRLSTESQPCLISFSINYSKSSQIQIYFHSLTHLPANLQQLTIKIKLIPDGKMKTLDLKNIISNENPFANENNEDFIQFSNISLAKLHEKAVVMKFFGKDQIKKNIQLGQIGKIYFNQLKSLQNSNHLDFIHEIEIIKLVRLYFFFV